MQPSTCFIAHTCVSHIPEEHSKKDKFIVMASEVTVPENLFGLHLWGSRRAMQVR